MTNRSSAGWCRYLLLYCPIDQCVVWTTSGAQNSNKNSARKLKLAGFCFKSFQTFSKLLLWRRNWDSLERSAEMTLLLLWQKEKLIVEIIITRNFLSTTSRTFLFPCLSFFCAIILMILENIKSNIKQRRIVISSLAMLLCEIFSTALEWQKMILALALKY